MAPWALAHAKMAEQSVRSSDYLSAQLGSNWSMPLEQIWYYECERGDAIRKNTLNKFLSEMPATDDEAFNSTNITVFDRETLDFYNTNVRTQPLWGVFGVRGPSEFVPPRLQPSEVLIDHSRPTVHIEADAGGGVKIPFDLVPLQWHGWDYEGDSKKGSVDKIYVWEPPIEGFEYGFGCDTGDGIDKDRSVIECLRKHSLEGPTKQVAEFASGHLSALDVWPLLLALGTWYSVPDRHGMPRQPRMAIECRGKGDMPQLILRLMNWQNFHLWNDGKIDQRHMKLDNAQKLGVFTNFYFRAAMIDHIVTSLRNGEIEICSPFFLKEMRSLEGDEMEQQLRAGHGGHDDRIMALGFILTSFYKFDANYWRASKVMAYSGRNPAHAALGGSLLLPNGETASSAMRAPKPDGKYAQWAWGTQSDTSGIVQPDFPIR
jgi:hypothetical protein